MDNIKRDPNRRQQHRVERRCGVDRRRVDVEYPGKHERRRGVESRKPEVVEREMSDSEWTALTSVTEVAEVAEVSDIPAALPTTPRT